MKKLVSILVITILILGSLFATSFKVLDIDRVRPGVQTAASRASEAKEDFTWDE